MKNRIDNRQLWIEYVSGKQAYAQLANMYHCSAKTISRRLDIHKVEVFVKAPSKVVVLMNVIYFCRNFGVMLFKDSYTNKNLLKYYVKSETFYL